MVLDSDIDMVYLAFWTSDPLSGSFGSRSFEVRYRMAYVNWLLHCGTPISGFDLICRRLSSHTHGRLVNGEILIYYRRAAPFEFEAS